MHKVIFSVVVPTYHRNDLLALCLDKLSPEKQTLPAELYEVIVTDDGSHSLAKEMVGTQYPWAKWVKGPGKGPAANRNNGAALANGEWLIFTDDDCLPHPALLSCYHQALVSFPDALAFEGAIEPETDSEKVDDPRFDCPVNRSGGNFWSANICIKKTLFKRIDGFDENYPLAALEDQDIFYRLQAQTVIPFLADAIVFHPFREVSYRKKIKRIPAMAQNWAYHAIKHKEKLGYATKMDIFWDSVVFYSKDILRQLIKGKAIISLFDTFYLLYGNSCLLYNLLKTTKGSNN